MNKASAYGAEDSGFESPWGFIFIYLYMTITLAYINFWKDPDNSDYFTHFIKEQLEEDVNVVHYSKKPDILIASINGPINVITNIRAKCKLFYYGENLNRYHPYNNENLLYNTFDLIVGFKKTDLSKKQIRFPLWLIYYNYYKWDDNDNILSYIQTKYNENIKKDKPIFGTLVCRHDRGGERTRISNELQKYGEIKYPGKFRKNTPSIDANQRNKINYISQSIYNICPENSRYEGYFTEKIFHAFEGGTIPLYWAVGLPEEKIINKNKYCFCDMSNKDKLEKSIRHVVENKDAYLKGNLFNNEASKEIQNFYDSLREGIMLYIK